MPVPTKITRAALKEVLERWRHKELSHCEVHEWAEARYAVSAFDSEDDVTNEVLAALDMLDVNVTTETDIPHLLEALSASSCETASAILSSMPFDLEQRRKQYRDDPVYGQFLR